MNILSRSLSAAVLVCVSATMALAATDKSTAYSSRAAVSTDASYAEAKMAKSFNADEKALFDRQDGGLDR
ncbi:MAG: hypothetical protein JO205_06025 [Pseudolabrys sp.]|nr:hypothetical protein [Pseudolabrys sp.]MBV9260912.1 hypothetical protein [Pseudolabrys sp.]